MATKTDRVLSALLNGRELTTSQIEGRYGVPNVTALVSNLRHKGFAVYANSRKNSKGKTITVYRLGTPSRAIVAAGYRALA